MNSCSIPTVRAWSATQSSRVRRSAMPTWPVGAVIPRASSFARVRGGIGQMTAHGLDLAEAELGQRIELAVEIAILAQRVELDR